MKKVYCFWLNKEVPIHDASAIYNPLNGVCWDCRACLDTMEKEEGKMHNPDMTEGILRKLNEAIQHLQNAIEKIAHGEAGFCLEEIHQAIDRACDAVEVIERG